jgi:ERCC4-type nuclease
VEVADIPGIGEKMARKLLQQVGGVAELAKLSQEQLMEIPGVGVKQAQRIRDYLAKRKES